MNNIITYYCCQFLQTAPLRLSSGMNGTSDSDLMLDGRGLPMIPGTSIAGVMRSMLENNELKRRLFGAAPKQRSSDLEEIESRVIFSDALLPSDAEVHITTRYGVGIGENGTAQPTAKFDFMVAETSAPYTAVIELPHAEDDDCESLLEALLKDITSNGISFGGRITRGYGRMNCTVLKRSFTMPADAQSWLAFDPFAPEAFSSAIKLENSERERAGCVIRAKLDMKGSFIVRVYSTEVGDADFAPLENSEHKPIIPGTSWSGSFRHHMITLAKETGKPELVHKIERLFGVPMSTIDRTKLLKYIEGKFDRARANTLESLIGHQEDLVDLNKVIKRARDEGEKPLADSIENEFGIIRSHISFMETAVDGGSAVTNVRVALDRFTMAPKKSALLTSTVWNGGSGDLEIRLDKPLECFEPEVISLLYASLFDLHNGILTFGGSSSIGYGRAEIKMLEINGQENNKLFGVELNEKEANGNE